MEQIHDRVAGLDVHRDNVVACVRVTGRRGGGGIEKERFATTTAELARLRDWLVDRQVSLVAMEATGVYWKPVYYALEDSFEVWLCNAQHVKNVPGRKTDMSDAEWLADVAAHGMVRPSFVPPPPIRELRELTRYRKTQIDARVAEAQRLEKLLQDALLTELPGGSLVSRRVGVSCVVTVRPRDWSRGRTAGSVVAGRAAKRVGRSDGRCVRAVSAC